MLACVLTIVLICSGSTSFAADTGDEVIAYIEKLKPANSGILNGRGNYYWTQILTEKSLARGYAMMKEMSQPVPKFEFIVNPDSTGFRRKSLLPPVPTEKDLITKKYFTYAFDGSKSVLYEYDTMEHERLLHKTVKTDDNVYKRIMYRYDKDGLDSETGMISPQFGDPAIENPLFFTTQFLDIVLSQYKNGYFESVLFDTAEYNGCACDVVTFEDAEKTEQYMFWISQEIGHKIVKIEITITQSKRHDEIEITYVKYKDYYVPHENVRIHFIDGEFASKHTISFQDDWEFNTDIAQEEFSIDFPVGMKVFNARTRESYIVE